MDPDAALTDARAHLANARELIQAETESDGVLVDADAIAEAKDAALERYEALDEWLTRGGFPPREWAGPGVGIPPDVEES